MNGLSWAARGGVAGFALGLLLALLFGARAETAMLRGLLAGVLIGGVSVLASSLNRGPSVADTEDA